MCKYTDIDIYNQMTQKAIFAMVTIMSQVLLFLCISGQYLEQSSVKTLHPSGAVWDRSISGQYHE